MGGGVSLAIIVPNGPPDGREEQPGALAVRNASGHGYDAIILPLFPLSGGPLRARDPLSGLGSIGLVLATGGPLSRPPPPRLSAAPSSGGGGEVCLLRVGDSDRGAAAGTSPDLASDRTAFTSTRLLALAEALLNVLSDLEARRLPSRLALEQFEAHHNRLHGPPPATREQREALPTRTVAAHSGAGSSSGGGGSGGGSGFTSTHECFICLAEYDEGDTLRSLPCCHDFHRDCVDRWLQMHGVCPICRCSVAPPAAAAPLRIAAGTGAAAAPPRDAA